MNLLRGPYHLGGLQVGGGINSGNALSYIEEGASHVIITSVCFFFIDTSNLAFSNLHITVSFIL